MEQPVAHMLMTTRLSLESNTASTSGYSSISFSSSLEDQPSEANDEDTSQNSNLSFGSSKDAPSLLGAKEGPTLGAVEGPTLGAKIPVHNECIPELTTTTVEINHRPGSAHGSSNASPRTGRSLPKWDTCDSDDSESGGYASLGSSQPSPYWTGNKKNSNNNDVDDISKCLSNICMGTSVTKIKRQNRTSLKTLYLDSSRTHIKWKPSKKGNKAKILIRSVKEVREGANTESFKKYVVHNHHSDDTNCFSIIHGTSWESLDLIADSIEDCRDWIRGLRFLIHQQLEEVKKEEADLLRDNWLKAVFKSADKSGDGLLSMDEVQRLLHKMNVNLSKRKVKQLFKEADTNTTDDNEGLLDFDEFVCFYKQLSTRPELLTLLQDYSGGKDYLTRQDFELFLRLEQGEKDIAGDAVKQLMERYEPVPENLEEGRFGIDGFTRYLLSEEGNIFNMRHRMVNQDMTQPLCHYYIASSHNTYLLGDQVLSHSSVDVYGAVLQSGCRCVEMDCWDGKDGEPVVYHGYTLTTKIRCRDVITVINKYAFKSSPYPVILSIENHCSIEQQKKLANYLINILGDKLVIPGWGLKKLPSPEDLQGKILIKTQKLPLDHDEELETGEVSEEDSADELEDDYKLEKSGASKFENLVVAQWALKKKTPIKPTHAAWQRLAAKARESSKRRRRASTGLTGTLRKLKASRKKSRGEATETTGVATENGEAGKSNLRRNQSAPNQPWKKKSIILSKQLSDLVKYTRSVAFSGFPADMPCWELPSLGEMRASNLVATRSTEFVTFTSRNLCRVYPSAYRIDSSNYNPQPMWNCGCQLVALNYQTEGRIMQIARAKFQSNGNCGYVLKPQVMREGTTTFEPNVVEPVTNEKKLITIRILSGQQLPKPPQSLLGERGEIIDPYVEVELVGLPVDCIKAVTRTVQDNGFNPNWNQLVFFTVHMPEVAEVRFAVWDEDPIGRDYIGQASIAIRSLMPGYRHIHLEGLAHATLFVHITIEDFEEKVWHRLTRARSNNKQEYARMKSVDLDIPVIGYNGKLSPRRGNRRPLTQRFNMMRRHTAAAIFTVEADTPSPTHGRRKRPNSVSAEVPLQTEGHGEEFKNDAIPVACDTIVMVMEMSLIQTDVAMDGSTKIPISELPRVYALNIPVSAILTGIQEKKLSLGCGTLNCLDAVEGNIASHRNSAHVVAEEEGGESLEEFSFLWEEHGDPLDEWVAPDRLRLPEHAFRGLENIAELRSIASSVDGQSSSSAESTDSSDDEGFVTSYRSRSRVGFGDLDRSDDDSDEPDFATIKRNPKILGQKYAGGMSKGTTNGTTGGNDSEKSRLSAAMEELNCDLKDIIDHIDVSASIDVGFDDINTNSHVMGLVGCGDVNLQSCSNGTYPAKAQNSQEKTNWSRILECKETTIGNDDTESASVLDRSKPYPRSLSMECNENKNNSMPGRHMADDNVSPDLPKVTQDRRFRKRVAEKYGVTLRDKPQSKKPSVFSIRFKSRRSSRSLERFTQPDHLSLHDRTNSQNRKSASSIEVTKRSTTKEEKKPSRKALSRSMPDITGSKNENVTENNKTGDRRSKLFFFWKI